MSNKDNQEKKSSENALMDAWIRKNGMGSQPIETGMPISDPSSQEKSLNQQAYKTQLIQA